ncbi:MAG: malectin domain-containing carbohydrate-binding protein [Pseudomonadota bacterium]
MRIFSFVAASAVIIGVSGSASAQEAFESIFINSGGDAITWNGQSWAADVHFQSGEYYADSSSSRNGLQEVFADTIYQTQRIDRGNAVPYAIPVGEGRYDLQLHFAELWHPAGRAGNRVFNLEVEGQTVGTDLDLMVQTEGDVNVPMIATVPGIDPSMSGSANLLEFSAIKVRDVPIISAIAVTCSAGATCFAPPDRSEMAAAAPLTLTLSTSMAEAAAITGVAAVPEAAAAPAEEAQIATTFDVRQFALRSQDLSRNQRDAQGDPLATASVAVLNFSDNPARADAPYDDVAMFPLAADQGFEGTDGVNDSILLSAKGQFTAAADGLYRFRTLNDDGVWVIVNGTPVISDPEFHGPTQFEGAVSLTAGVHDIEVLYMEADRGALLVVEAEQPDGTFALLQAGQTLEPSATTETEPKGATIGYYDTQFNVTIPGGIIARRQQAAAVFLSTGDVALMTINIPGIVQCQILFEPAATFEEMTLRVHTCGDTGGDYSVTTSDTGNPIVTGQLRNDIWAGAWTFQFTRQRIEPAFAGEKLRPNIPLDFAGVEFAGTVEDVKAAVAAAYTPTDPVLAGAEADGWRDNGNRGGVRTFTYEGSRGGTGSPETLNIVQGNNDGEDYLFAYRRITFPDETNRATAQVLQDALRAKYGPASGRWAGTGKFGGLYWSFDEAGRQLRGPEARRCVDYDAGGFRVPEWELYQLASNGAIPAVDMPPRSGCGVQVSIRHPVFDDPLGRPAWTMFTAFDVSPRAELQWDSLVNGAKDREVSILQTAEKNAAEQERIQSISPDL